MASSFQMGVDTMKMTNTFGFNKVFTTLSLVLFVSIGLAATEDEIRGAIAAGDFESARSMAVQLIKKNDPIGYYTLGWLEERRKTEKGYKAAFSSYLKAANLGHTKSMHYAAQMLKEGQGTKKNMEQAVFWYGKAAEDALPEAMFELAHIYRGEGGMTVNNKKAYDLYYKIASDERLSNTELSTLSMFYMGLLTRDSPDPKSKELSENLFEIVMQSKLQTKQVEWAKSEIQSYAEAGKTKVGKGDGSADDGLCQKYGFKIATAPYSECRMKVEIARKQNEQSERIYAQQKRQYEAELQRYQEQAAAYEREKERQKGLAMMKFGLALMGGQSPNASENLANAGRSVLGMPPIAPTAPTFQTFTITGLTGRMVNCNVFGNNVNCN